MRLRTDWTIRAKILIEYRSGFAAFLDTGHWPSPTPAFVIEWLIWLRRVSPISLENQPPFGGIGRWGRCSILEEGSGVWTCEGSAINQHHELEMFLLTVLVRISSHIEKCWLVPPPSSETTVYGLTDIDIRNARSWQALYTR